MRLVLAVRTVITRGYYAGEVGVSYSWADLDRTAPYGDFSGATGGRLQGYDEPCTIRIPDDCEIVRAVNGDMIMVGPHDTRGVDAEDALALHMAEVVA